jgi:dTDP-4-dehydrorhamnose reductase
MALDCVRAGLRGVFNLGCRDGASKCDFALAIARLFGLGTESATPAPSSSVPGRAVRAKDLRMAVGKIEAMLGRPMPTLAEEIAKLRGASA